MGLDMYLAKKVYVKNWEHTPEDERWHVSVQQGGQTVQAPHLDVERVSSITQEVGYWRKANAIHRWFVEQVQEGVDNCGTYDVSAEQLRTLLDTVTRVLEASELVAGDVITGYQYKDGTEEPIVEEGRVIKDPTMAHALLPTQEGCFFGSTEYDQYYIEDLQETKQMLEAALRDPDGEFEYSSSW